MGLNKSVVAAVQGSEVPALSWCCDMDGQFLSEICYALWGEGGMAYGMAICSVDERDKQSAMQAFSQCTLQHFLLTGYGCHR